MVQRDLPMMVQKFTRPSVIPDKQNIVAIFDDDKKIIKNSVA
jgi:hypothetical protein